MMLLLGFLCNMREIILTLVLHWCRITPPCWSELHCAAFLTFYSSINGFQKLWAKGVLKCLGNVQLLNLFTAGLHIPCFYLILIACLA